MMWIFFPVSLSHPSQEIDAHPALVVWAAQQEPRASYVGWEGCGAGCWGHASPGKVNMSAQSGMGGWQRMFGRDLLQPEFLLEEQQH